MKGSGVTPVTGAPWEPLASVTLPVGSWGYSTLGVTQHTGHRYIFTTESLDHLVATWVAIAESPIADQSYLAPCRSTGAGYARVLPCEIQNRTSNFLLRWPIANKLKLTL